jgi:hypothetical protein
VDSVGHRRGKQLADDGGGLTVAVGQDVGSEIDVLASDQIEDLTGLVGRHAAVAQDRPGPFTLVGLHSGHVSASLRALGPHGT